MVKNFSSSQKTLKSVLQASQSDAWCIDRCILYGNYLDMSVLPDGLILDDYYDYFETLLKDVEVPEKYYYSPTGFAEYYYGDAQLDFLVLYFACIPTLFEFNKPVIKAFPPEYLKELNKLTTYKKKEVQESRSNPTEYKAFDDIVNQPQAYEDYFRI